MPFKNRAFQKFLKVYDSLANVAINIASGANTYGIGQAVIQFFTNDVSEQAPAEITTNAQVVTGYAGNPRPTDLSLEISSPTQGTANQPQTRSILTLHTKNTKFGLLPYAQFEVSTLIILPPRSGADPANSQLSVGQIFGPSSLTDTRLHIGDAVFDAGMPNLNPQTFSLTNTGITGLTVRASPYDFTFTQVGKNLCMVNGQLSNAAGGSAIANGGTVIAAGQIPAWALPPAGNIQTVAASGAPNASQTTVGEINGSTGTLRFWGGTIPAGSFVAFMGVYNCVGT